MVKLKELIQIEAQYVGNMKGNLACAGCGLNLALRHALAALDQHALLVVPACCTSVIQGFGEGYGINAPVFNTAFAASPAVASGFARVYKKKDPSVQVVVWAGDGGTADIGLATLSGAAERDEDIIYVMYNNEAYQNTGDQKSGATPPGAVTTTSSGEKRPRKSVSRLMITHGVRYVATANTAYPLDLYDKMKRAYEEFRGHFRFIEIYAPCPAGWNVDPRYTAKVGKLAVETGYWPLYEAVDGKITLSRQGRRFIDPEKRKPLEDWLKLQGRFKKIKPEFLEALQYDIDRSWDFVKKYLAE